MKVRIGFGLGTQGLAGEASFAAIVEHLERLRFDSIWLAERVAGTTLDPIVALSLAAGLTRRLKLGTGVLILPGRNPATLAKQLATLDRLSQGRLLLAFGSGARDPAEAQVFNVPERERGAWIDEALPLLRRFWTEDAVDHDGPRFAYRSLAIRPFPLQNPLDVWLGGSGPKALQRLGRLADGWLPSLCTPTEASAGRVLIENAAREAGRVVDPEHFGANLVYALDEVPEAHLRAYQMRRPDADVGSLVPVGLRALQERIKEFVDHGFSKFVLRPAAEPAAWEDELSALADAALPLQS